MSFSFPNIFNNFEKFKKLFENSDKVTLNVNGFSKSIILELVPFFSSKLTDYLLENRNMHVFNIEMNFRNQENITKIFDIFETCKPITNDEVKNRDDVFDFAEFGFIIGNKDFIEPLKLYIKMHEKEELDLENVISFIEEKQALFKFNNEYCSIERELQYIRSNFSQVSKNEDFIKWCHCENNYDYVDQIINNKGLKLDSEDDLVTFIFSVNESNQYVHLFDYVLLQHCSVKVFKQFYEYINRDDLDIPKSCHQILKNCLNRRLFFDNWDEYDFQIEKERYNSSFIQKIKDNNIPLVESTIKSQKSTLDSQKSILDSQKSTLDSQKSTLDSQKSKLSRIRSEAENSRWDSDYKSRLNRIRNILYE